MAILKIPYIVRKESKGYVTECVDLNIVSQGDTLREARKNIREAISLHFKTAQKLGFLDRELEKLGVIKGKNGMQVMPRELESSAVEIPGIPMLT